VTKCYFVTSDLVNDVIEHGSYAVTLCSNTLKLVKMLSKVYVCSLRPYVQMCSQGGKNAEQCLCVCVFHACSCVKSCYRYLPAIRFSGTVNLDPVAVVRDQHLLL